MNIILEFSSYIKNVLDFFTKGVGLKPDLDLNECKNFKDLALVTAGDNNGITTIGAINKEIKAIYITTAHLTSKKVIVLKTSWKRKLNPLNPFSLLQICIQGN